MNIKQEKLSSYLNVKIDVQSKLFKLKYRRKNFIHWQISYHNIFTKTYTYIFPYEIY